jgi:diguanylate cyclase (GGDEF)-like protein
MARRAKIMNAETFEKHVFLRLLSQRVIRHSSSDDKILYLLLVAYIGFTAIGHLSALVFFLVAGQPALTAMNAAGLLFCALASVLLGFRRYMLSGLLVSVEVVAYTSAGLLMIGHDTYLINMYLAILMGQVLVPYARSRVRLGVAVAIVLIVFAQVVCGFDYAPPIALGEYHRGYALLNIALIIAYVLAALYAHRTVSRVLRQMAELKSKKLADSANTDYLTGLGNRRRAEVLFARMQRRKTRGADNVAMLDIDNFKSINDTYGHVAGDSALKICAETCRKILRKTDTVIRWGGEEFLILLADTETATAVKALDKLRQAIHRESRQRGLDLSDTMPGVPAFAGFTVTIGVAPLDLEAIDASIEACDQKLYQGKSAGKNRVVA